MMNQRKRHLSHLYDLHAEAVYGFLLQVAQVPEDARDLLQEVFLRVSQNLKRVQGARSPRAYILKISWHLHLDHSRHRQAQQRRERRFMEEQPKIYEITEDPDAQAFRHRLQEIMAALPQEQRAVVHLHLWEDLTFDRIGETLGISPNTASSRYRYALTKLRHHMNTLRHQL